MATLPDTAWPTGFTTDLATSAKLQDVLATARHTQHPLIVYSPGGGRTGHGVVVSGRAIGQPCWDSTVAGRLERPARPVLNTDTPDALRGAIKRAYVAVPERIGERTRVASPAATGEPSVLAVTSSISMK
jgi:hypothetical protein